MVWAELMLIIWFAIITSLTIEDNITCRQISDPRTRELWFGMFHVKPAHGRLRTQQELPGSNNVDLNQGRFLRPIPRPFVKKRFEKLLWITSRRRFCSENTQKSIGENKRGNSREDQSMLDFRTF